MSHPCDWVRSKDTHTCRHTFFSALWEQQPHATEQKKKGGDLSRLFLALPEINGVVLQVRSHINDKANVPRLCLQYTYFTQIEKPNSQSVLLVLCRQMKAKMWHQLDQLLLCITLKTLPSSFCLFMSFNSSFFSVSFFSIHHTYMTISKWSSAKVNNSYLLMLSLRLTQPPGNSL